MADANEARTSALSDTSQCPKCGGQLSNPAGLGWCPKCGYCRSVDEDSAKVLEGLPPTLGAGQKPSFLGMAEFAQLVANFPSWVWVLLGGALAVVAVSFVGSRLFAAGTLGQAVFSTVELFTGLLAIFFGQLWLLAMLAPEDDKLGPKDAILSWRLWTLSFGKLPRTRKPVYIGGWGATAGLCAVFLVGGLGYWEEYLTPKKRADQQLVAAAGGMGKGDGDLTKAVKDMADTQDLTKEKEKKDKEKEKKDKEKEADKRPTVQCLVVGYVPGAGADEVSALVCAAFREDKLQYAGIVKTGLTPDKTRDLAAQIAKVGRAEPLPEYRNVVSGAVFLEPKVFVSIHTSGFDRDGKMLDPKFKEVLASR